MAPARRFLIEIMLSEGDNDAILLGSMEAVKNVLHQTASTGWVTGIDPDEVCSFVPSSYLIHHPTDY